MAMGCATAPIPRDELGASEQPLRYVSAVNALGGAKFWSRAVSLLRSATLARIRPHERLRNSGVAATARVEVWQMAMQLRPRLGNAAELELLAALERRDVWRSVPSLPALQDVALGGLAEKVRRAKRKKGDRNWGRFGEAALPHFHLSLSPVVGRKTAGSGAMAAAVDLQMVHFEEKLQKAMQDVKLILDSEKCMSLPQETHHTYEDKFGLVERCSLLTLASHWNSLELMGLTKEALLEAKDWADGNAEVSLRFRADERCEFLREECREVEEPSCGGLDISSVGVALGIMSKTVTRVTEYLWHFEVTYTLDLLRGVGAQPHERRTLTTATTSAQLTTTAKVAPRKVQVPAISKEINMTFLLKHLEPSGDGYCPRFQIPRDSPKTKTPRRNQQVEEMWLYLQNLKAFAGSVERYLSQLQQADAFSQSCPSTEAVFVPTLPLLRVEGCPEEESEQPETRMCVRLDADQHDDSGLSVSSVDCNRLLAEEMRSLAVKRQELSEACTTSHGVFRLQEATLVLALKHCLDVVERWCDSVDFVESLLRRQLSACIGRSLTAVDVANYMRFHHRKLFAAPYQPRPFSFSVRSARNRCAEGVVSIEEDGGAPVWSMCARRSEQTMKFALDASTRVSFTGDLHLHAWLAERFEGKATSKLSLVSRARQFSCFMVLLCKVIARDELEVSHAVLLQNKDEVQIPLELATIPTPKEFKDAIESLSPEQQQFAKEHDSWCLGCTGLESLKAELAGNWPCAALRDIANDLVVSAVRGVSALRRTSGSIQSAGISRAAQAPPAPPVRSSSAPAPREARGVTRTLPPPPVPPKRQEESEESEEEEEEDREAPSTHRGATAKAPPARRPVEPRHPPPEHRHHHHDRDRERERSRSHHKSSGKKRRSGKKQRGNRAGASHQRLHRALDDPSVRLHRKPPQSFWQGTRSFAGPGPRRGQ
eukprot:s858_g14.t1